MAGRYCAFLVASTTKPGILYHRVSNIVPGTPYLLTFKASKRWMANEKPATLRVAVEGASESSPPAQNVSNMWADYTVPFMANATSVTIRLHINGQFFVDGFKLACKVSHHKS